MYLALPNMSDQHKPTGYIYYLIIYSVLILVKFEFISSNHNADGWLCLPCSLLEGNYESDIVRVVYRFSECISPVFCVFVFDRAGFSSVSKKASRLASINYLSKPVIQAVSLH